MSGFALGLGNFAQGFASSRNMVDERKQREADRAQQDRYIEAMGRTGASPASYGPPPGGGTGMGMGIMPSRSGGAGRPAPAQVSASGGLFDLIDKTEGAGNYDTLFGHSQNGGRFNGVKVSEMTLSQLYDFTNPSGEYGQWVKAELARSGHKARVATPMGRHQIVGTTLRRTAEGMGLSPDSKFTPQLQDSMANYLARNRLSGAKSQTAKRSALRAEWEGFKHVSDSALDSAIAHFETTGGMPVRSKGIGPS